jgi:hypothetical protein
MHVEIMNMKLKNDFTKNVTDDIPVGDGPNGVDVNSNTNMGYMYPITTLILLQL